MSMEPWFLFPPEANFRRLEGTPSPARAAAAEYHEMAAGFHSEAQNQYNNAMALAESNIGHVGEKIEQVGRAQREYINELAQQAHVAAQRLTDVADKSDITRKFRIPLEAIEENKAWQEAAKAQLPFNPAAPAILAAALAAYGAMWTINASAGTAFDTAAVKNSLPVSISPPPMSLALNSPHVGQMTETLGQLPMQTHGPAVTKSLTDSQAVAQQMITPINGLRGGGLGSGRTMPYVGANPTLGYPRGGMPEFRTTRSLLGTTERAGELTAFNPGATTGPARYMTPTAPSSSIRAVTPSGMSPSTTGGTTMKSLGGRVGPSFTGINALDKTLGNMQKPAMVGQQATAGTTGTTAATVGQQQGARGGFGPMGAAGRAMNNTEEKTTSMQGYVAKEVSFTSLADEEELNKRRESMFK